MPERTPKSAKHGQRGTADFARGERWGVDDQPGYRPDPLELLAGPRLQGNAEEIGAFFTLANGGAHPIRWRIANGGAGLRLDHFTGVLSGTPRESQVVIEATDDWLQVATLTIGGLSLGTPILLSPIDMASLRSAYDGAILRSAN